MNVGRRKPTFFHNMIDIALCIVKMMQLNRT